MQLFIHLQWWSKWFTHLLIRERPLPVALAAVLGVLVHVAVAVFAVEVQIRAVEACPGNYCKSLLFELGDLLLLHDRVCGVAAHALVSVADGQQYRNAVCDWPEDLGVRGGGYFSNVVFVD